MGKANPETCSHPATKLATAPSFGHTQCTRCDADLTPTERMFTVRAGERTTFTQGDRLHVKANGPDGHAYKATFQWAFESPTHGLMFTVAEKQLYRLKDSGPWLEGTQAIRTVSAEHVRHDDGVRNRRVRREEAQV